MDSHTISKGLEVWTLQTLLNLSILLGVFTLGLAIISEYFDSLKEKLTLRVSIEIWEVITILITDLLLAFVVIVGFLVLNPDIMADIKIAIPFIPVATILFAIALVLRLFHGGHKRGSKNFIKSVYLIFAANIINIIGFSIVMEAPSGEYLEIHPSAFWSFIKANFRSNAIPNGLENAQLTFYFCFPLLILVFVWGFVSFIKKINNQNEK